MAAEKGLSGGGLLAAAAAGDCGSGSGPGTAPLHRGLGELGLAATADMVRRGQVRGVRALGRVLGARLGQRMVLVALAGRAAAGLCALHE